MRTEEKKNIWEDSTSSSKILILRTIPCVRNSKGWDAGRKMASEGQSKK